MMEVEQILQLRIIMMERNIGLKYTIVSPCILGKKRSNVLSAVD
jgi:hypothetical protein